MFTKFMLSLCLCVPFMSACGDRLPAQSPVAVAAVDPGDGSNCETFEHLKDIVRVCYDRSEPGVSCDDMRGIAVEAGLRIDLKPSQQEAVAELCGNSCDARKRGVTWSDVDDELHCPL
jgi:hypothetical protein